LTYLKTRATSNLFRFSSSSSATGPKDVGFQPQDRRLNEINISISKYRSQLATARLLRLFDASTGCVNLTQLFDDDREGIRNEELQGYHQQQRFLLLQIISRIVDLGYDGRDDHRIALTASLAIEEQEESLGSRC
jgi:hypothetical protein